MGNSLISRIRQPVRREGADKNLLITLLSFATSVVLTRLFLELTGYPQLGTSTLHIAHVLWGGLFLFVASLLPLLLANRWVYTVGALFSGIGVGLFIDEVGKFITQTNDYFYPLAAPIIYTFFLLTVFLYLQIRRPPSRDPRAELYRALDSLAEVLDHDLDPQEYADLEARLRQVAQQASSPALARLAYALLDFLASDSIHLVPPRAGFWSRCSEWIRDFERRWLSRRRLKMILITGLGILGLLAFADLAVLLFALFGPGDVVEQLAAILVMAGRISDNQYLDLYLARMMLEGGTGSLLMVAAGLMAIGQERRGLSLVQFSLLLSLTTVNLLVFYFDQFRAVADAAVQFGLLLIALYYRGHYRQPDPPPQVSSRERQGSLPTVPANQE